MRIVLEDLNLDAAYKRLVEEALNIGGSIVEAAQLLGVTRRECKRLIIMHNVQWPRGYGPAEGRA